MNTLLSNLLRRRSSSPTTYRVAADLFLRALGFVYLIAIVSLWVQIDGLIGQNGVLPAANFLDFVRSRVGDNAVRVMPTLCWLSSSDAFLHFLCGVGTLLSVLLIAGLVPLFATVGLWVVYLSLTLVGQLFLGFQWDNLLLEAGFLAIWLAPWVLCSRPSTNPEPPRLVVFLFHLLLFKLMFLSGFVKLASKDEAWWSLSALTYHYWSQPLPPWTAWYIDKLPSGFHSLCTGVMFFIELVIPFLIFGPRVARQIAFVALVFLQIVIAVTGNYCFFNLLTMALCIPLLDDRTFPHASRAAMPKSNRWHRWATYPVTAVLLLLNAMVLGGSLRFPIAWPGPVERIYRWVAPFRSVNSYGLFAVMTKNRPEIVLEGSNDGVTWQAYEFRWKPGDVQRRPRFVAPHQPRLDWQFWFAALGNIEGNRWVLNVIVRLLEGKPEVLEELGYNPFPASPPLYIRASLYEYRFSRSADRRETGAWWTREPKGLYCQPVSLKR